MKFWTLWQKCKDDAFELLEGHPASAALSTPMKLLIEYKKFMDDTNWPGNIPYEDALHDFLRRQLRLIIQKRHEWSFEDWFSQEELKLKTKKKKAETLTKLSWNSLSPHDWHSIISSVLLPSSDRKFWEAFGREKIELEKLQIISQPNLLFTYLPELELMKKFKQLEVTSTGSIYHNHNRISSSHTMNINSEISTLPSPRHLSQFKDCPGLEHALSGTYDTAKGKFQPKYKQVYDMIVQIDIPESLSDPSHWGHIAWNYLKLIK